MKRFALLKYDVVIGFVCVVALVVAVFVSNLFFVHNAGLPAKRDEWGTLGDFFGGTLNPIFALFSFIALMVTIRFQVHALADSRASASDAGLQFEAQRELGRRQAFEQTFFNMVNVRIEFLKAMEHTSSECGWGEAPLHKYTSLRADWGGSSSLETYQSGIASAFKTSPICTNFTRAFSMLIMLYTFVEDTFPEERYAAEQKLFTDFLGRQLTPFDKMLAAYMLIANQNTGAIDTIRRFRMLSGVEDAMSEHGIDRYWAEVLDRQLVA